MMYKSFWGHFGLEKSLIFLLKYLDFALRTAHFNICLFSCISLKPFLIDDTGTLSHQILNTWSDLGTTIPPVFYI